MNFALPFIVRLAALEQLKNDPLVDKIDLKLRTALTGSPAAQKFINGDRGDVPTAEVAEEKQIEFFRKMYGVEVTIDYPDLLRLLLQLRKNLSLYPPAYVRVVLDKIFLRETGPGRGGFARGREFTLEHRPVMNGSLHHELEHVSDHFDNGLYGSENNAFWASLNPRGYAAYYKGDFENCRRKSESGRRRPSGFPSYYGHCNPNEDQAEVTELLMGGPNKNARELAQADAVLARKIEQVKTYMRRRSNGLMDDQYWQDLKAGKVDETYWVARAEALQK